MSFAAWKYVTPIEMVNTFVPADESNFVWYYDLANLPSEAWAHIKANGEDIIIADEDGTTRYPLHVVDCDIVAKKGQIWGKGPAKAASNEKYSFYAGNSSAVQPGVSDTYGQYNVYPSNNIFRLHLEEEPDNTAGQIKDSTSNQNNGQTSNMDSSDSVSVKIQKGLDFDGSNDILLIPDSSTLDITTQASWSFWCTPANVTKNFAGLFDRYASPNRSYGMYQANSGEINFRVWNSGLNDDNTSSGLGLANGVLCKIDITFNSSTIKFYKNGNLIDTKTSAVTSIDTSDNDLEIACYSGVEFPGKLDEIVHRSSAISDDLIELEYNNQNNNSNFWSTGSEIENIVTLSTPLDTATGIEVEPTFTWEEMPGADTYNLQVSEDIGFGTTVINETLIATNSYNASGLDGDTTYYWRVAHVDTTGVSEWSEIFSFTTKNVDPDVGPGGISNGNLYTIHMALTNMRM